MRSLDYKELMRTEWPSDIIFGVPGAPEDSILSRGDRLVLAGEQKSGKSVLVAQMVRGLTMGTDWLGFPVLGGPRCVLYVQAELRPGRLKKRYGPWEAANQGAAQVPEGKFYIWSTEGPLYLTGLADYERLPEEERRERGRHPLMKLYDEINEVKPDVIVFDPFVCFHDGEEKSGQDLMKFLTLLDDIKNHAAPDRGGAAIVIVHHFRKQDPKEIGKIALIERFRGSSVLAGWADSLIGIGIGDQPDSKYLEFTLRDSDSQPKRNLKYNYERKEFDWSDPAMDMRDWALRRLQGAPEQRERRMDFTFAIRSAAGLQSPGAEQAERCLMEMLRRRFVKEEEVGRERWIVPYN